MTPYPQQIGDYRIVDVLGRGGMGVVYRASDPSGADLAVKTVRVATESTLASIRREIQTLRELRHPGVVAIRDHGIAEGMPWYAMDLLRGRTLRDDLRAWFPAVLDPPTTDLRSEGSRAERVAASAAATPPYSLAHVATLFCKMCVPLAYLHGCGVIHRDLSPANVFLVGADQPVLFDFGLAAQFRVDSARDVLELGGALRGTAHYMAPEQARGEVVDARADIYALGCMLYEALTGRPPFLGESPLAVALQHIEGVPEPPSRHAHGLPAAFDELVMRLLAKAPRDRIGYADDVATALERLGAPAALPYDIALRPRAYTYRPGLAGRTELISAYDELLHLLAAGAGGCAALIGESGVGKTRLAGEIATRAVGSDIRVIIGECEPVGTARDDRRAAPLHPLRPLLRLIGDRCRDAGPDETARLLGRSGALLAAYEPSLAELVPPMAEHVEPDAARFLVLAVLRDLLAELARGGPVLLVLDDLQWADELTIALLRSLPRELLERHGVFVLVTARAEEMTPELEAMLDGLGAIRFEVPRLGHAAVGAMVRDMLALEDDAPTLTDFVASRSEGNPLFAAEYVRTAVDEGVLHRDAAGRWRLVERDTPSYNELPTPGSVHELVRRRLRSLSNTAREIALAAAVLGRSCAPDVLAEVAGLDDDAARTAIAEAIQRHVFEDQPDGSLRFVHDKLREQAYAELDEPARRQLHCRTAEALERHFRAGDLALHLSQLAHHWEVAGDLVRAGDYLEWAARHALDSAAYGEAHALLRRLIELPITVSPARRAGWERRLGVACLSLGDVEGCAANVERSLGRLGRSLPSSRLGWAAVVARGVARQVWSRSLGRRWRAPSSEPQTIEAALASARMTTCYFFKGDSLGLIGAALTAANLAESAGAGVAIAEIYAQLGYIAGLARLRGVAHAYFAKARDTAHATRDPIGLVRALYCEAAFDVGIGAWGAARTAVTAGLAIARELRNPQEAEDAHTIIGHIDFATGDYAASLRETEALLESARARANTQHEAWGIYNGARAALYLGDLDAAIRDFERALALLASHPDHASRVLCHGMLASALVRAGAHARAKAAADAATALIGSRRPTVFTISEGFVGAADAYLELARLGDRDALLTARVAVDNLARLARVFPIAAPAARTLAGIYQLRAGEPDRATRPLERGLALAEQLAMPYDQAVAHRALASVVGGDHAAHARRLFSQLGCRWHMEHLAE